MRRAAILLLLAGCTSKVPAVDPAAFACEDDASLSDGSAPCPDSHWCLDQSCTPRFGCFIEGGSRPGCDPDNNCLPGGQLELCYRCELRLNAFVAAVACGPGVQTETSTRPATLERCECPDGTSCVAFSAGGSGDGYPLYLLPPGVPVPPPGRAGFTTDIPERRMCTPVCSSELDCPAAHTCRAAAALIEDAGSKRSTIGVCWPDKLSSTSTTTSIEQPDPDACFDHEECSAGAQFEPCRFRTLIVPDHPRVPIGDVWGTRYALISRCSRDTGTPLKVADSGCTEDSECLSGLCASGRCGRPCDPALEDPCPSRRACKDTRVIRTLPGDFELEERAQICDPP